MALGLKFILKMPVAPVYDFDIDLDGQILRVATFGRGAWKSPIFDVCDLTLDLTPADDPGIPGFSGMQDHETGQSLTSTRIVEGGDGQVDTSDLLIMLGAFGSDCGTKE